MRMITIAKIVILFAIRVGTKVYDKSWSEYVCKMFKGEKLIYTKIFRRKKTIKSLKLTDLVRENFLGTFYLVML